MPTLNPALSEVIAQPDPIREFKYEGEWLFLCGTGCQEIIVAEEF
jgi:hypothetical protein